MMSRADVRNIYSVSKKTFEHLYKFDIFTEGHTLKRANFGKL